MWKDEKTLETKKNWHTMDICRHFDFGYDWRYKMMSEPKKKKKKELAHNGILALAYSFDTL